jgi:Arc/MetJ-type ribon-helix-helix transcriptional regulator
MDTLKINVSLPVRMYEDARVLVEKGLYSSFSEIVRVGLRSEMDFQREINQDFVKSVKAAEKSKYKRFKSSKDMIASLQKASE